MSFEETEKLLKHGKSSVIFKAARMRKVWAFIVSYELSLFVFKHHSKHSRGQMLGF